MCQPLELTIFSGHRESGSSIGKASYRLNNGPIFVSKIAVKSCTMYNTTPNVADNRSTLRFLQYGGPNLDSQGIIEVSVVPGGYTGTQLAVALEQALVPALSGTPDAGCSVFYNQLTRRMEFTFDSVYSYSYASEYAQYLITSPGFTFFWQYIDSAGIQHLESSTFDSGTFLVRDWLKYCGEVFSQTAQLRETPLGKVADIRLSMGAGLRTTVQTNLPATQLQVAGGFANSRFFGMDGLGMQNPAQSYTSTVDYPFTALGQPALNPMEAVLNFSVDGVVAPNSWTSGQINLSGDLYLHFKSRTLANRGHRTIPDSRDTTFFSMPVTTTFQQLGYYEPNERVWINFEGGLELTSFEIDLENEFGQRVSPSQDYVLELLIQQTDVF